MEIPYHVHAIGMLMSLIKSETNIATGEIRKFAFTLRDQNTHKFGDTVCATEFMEGNDYETIWVHLINDYFKMIGRWPSPTC